MTVFAPLNCRYEPSASHYGETDGERDVRISKEEGKEDRSKQRETETGMNRCTEVRGQRETGRSAVYENTGPG